MKWSKTLRKKFIDSRKRSKLSRQIRDFLNGENPQVFLDISSSMEYYVRENKIDIERLLRLIYNISPFMLWGLSHEIVHLKTVLRDTDLDDLKINWGGGTDLDILSNCGNPVIFITDEGNFYQRKPIKSRLLILCVADEMFVSAQMKSLSINIKGLFTNG